jgi:hypothetical protein
MYCQASHGTLKHAQTVANHQFMIWTGQGRLRIVSKSPPIPTYPMARINTARCSATTVVATDLAWIAYLPTYDCATARPAVV